MIETIDIYNELFLTNEIYTGLTSTVTTSWTNISATDETSTILFNIKDSNNVLIYEYINVVTLVPGESKIYVYFFTPSYEGTYELNVTTICPEVTCNLVIE